MSETGMQAAAAAGGSAITGYFNYRSAKKQMEFQREMSDSA